MRKILSLVLVLSLVLGSFGFAFAAPADVEGTDYEDAVTRLSALDVLAGFPDGTFRPNETVTRAQFAKIMANAVGVGEAAKYATGATKFADVPADHWAAGYINVVSDMKIVNGYGDGNFGPENQVTYAEAVTMIVRALGYEPKAQAVGGFPGGYLAVAAEEDITEDVNVVNTLAATRGDVAKMVDASLDVNLMFQKTWGQYPEYANDDDSKTLLKTKLGVDEVEGVVIEIPNTKSSLKANEIVVDRKDDSNKTYKLLTEDVNYDTLLGLEVTLWADGSDVVNLDIDSDEDEIKFDTISTDTTKEKVGLYVEDDTFEWAKDAKVYINFEEKSIEDLVAKKAELLYGYTVLNSDDDATYVNVFDFAEVENGVVYDVDGDEYKYVSLGNTKDELDLKDKAYKDGVHIYNEKLELVEQDAIKVNSAIYAWENSDELYLLVDNSTVSGELERVYTSKVKVNGDNYDASVNETVYSADDFDNFDTFGAIADLNDLNGENVTVVLDLNDEAFLIYGDSEKASSTLYGVVTYAEKGKKGEMTVYTKDGSVDYEFDTRSEASKVTNASGDFYGQVKGSGTSDLQFSAVEFKLNKDGKVKDDIVATKVSYNNLNPQATGMLSVTKEADKKYFEYGSTSKLYFDENTIFMTALSGEKGTAPNKYYELDPEVLSYEDVYEAVYTSTEVVVIREAGRDADLVVFVEPGVSGVDDDYLYGIVKEVPYKKSGDWYVTIFVAGEGEKDYLAADETVWGEGQLVQFTLNSSDEAVLKTNNKYPAEAGIANHDKDNDEFDGKYYRLDSTEAWVKVNPDAVIRELDTKDCNFTTPKIDVNNDKLSRSKLEKFDHVDYILGDDAEIIAAVVWNDVDSTSGGGSNVQNDGSLKYEFTVGADATVRIGDKSYEITSTALVIDKDEEKIADNYVLPANTKVKFTTVEGADKIDVLQAVELDKTDLALRANIDAVDTDTAALAVSYNGIAGSVTLAGSGSNGTTIAWAEKTDASSVASLSGTTLTITRDTTDNTNDTVVLTATITKVNASDTKDITLTVKEAKNPTVTALSFNGAEGAYTLSGTSTVDIVFSEELDTASKSSVEALITDEDATFSWSGATLTIGNDNESTTDGDGEVTIAPLGSDITDDITDLAGNTSSGVTIVDDTNN